MNNSEKLLKLFSSFFENGILSSQDVKKELLNKLNFKKDKIVNKLDLVSRKEFEVLKQIVLKQEKELKNFKKKRTK